MSIKQTLSTTLALLVVAGAVNTVSAANVLWLKDSALSKMTSEDMESLRSAARNVLDYGPDNASRRWENAQTGARGVVTPLDSFERDGTFCRRLEAFSEVKGVSGRGVYVFCRQGDGTWRIPTSSSQ